MDQPSHFSSLRIKQMDPSAVVPRRAHPDDAGLDLSALEDTTLEAHEGKLLRTGIAIALPIGHVGLVADRSSLAKRGLKTSGGVIDAGYRGEIHIVLRNLTSAPVTISKGDRIAQLLILPVATPTAVLTDDLDETERGSKGFGSSGK